MKYYLLLTVTVLLSQCSISDDLPVDISIFSVNSRGELTSTFRSDERVLFKLELTNQSLNNDILWNLQDGDWNTFTIRKNVKEKIDWFKDDSDLCPAPWFEEMLIEAGSREEFSLSGRGTCFYYQPLMTPLSEGIYELRHHSKYTFTSVGNRKSFEVKLADTYVFEIVE